MINLKEINFEKYITDYLVTQNGYTYRGANESGTPLKDQDYSRELALDSELLEKFIKSTQPNEWQRLQDLYPEDTIHQFAKRIDKELSQVGVLGVLRDGVSDRGVHIDLMYTKPNTGFNEDARKLYDANIFSVIRQVYFSPKDERSVDLVLFLNGIPIATAELKNQLTGQNVVHAIHQYKTDRMPTDKLFAFKRALVHFAVDNNSVYMTTKIDGLRTFFLPFNIGHENGSANPPVKNKFAVHYLWEDVLTKDSMLEIISRFAHVQIEKKQDKRTGRTVKKKRCSSRGTTRDRLSKNYLKMQKQQALGKTT